MMGGIFKQSMLHELSNLYFWMGKVNKSILTGETCFLESNFAMQAAHRIDNLKEIYKDAYEKCDWLELVKEARKDADKRLLND